VSGEEARRRAAELLEGFGLTDVGGRWAGTYSGGMRRRLDLAASLAAEPAVIVLDEPAPDSISPAARQCGAPSRAWRGAA
jgi:ABC-type multidrug transport system ATPase subunit